MSTAPDTLAARRRPFVIAAVWLLKLATAYALAAPVLRAVRATGIALRPGGDSELFAPGGMLLLEALRLARADLAAALFSIALVAPAALLLTGLGTCAIMTAVAMPGRLVAGRFAWRALALLPRFAGLGLGLSLVQGALGFACIGPALGLFAAFDSVQGGALADAVLLIGILLASTAICGVGVVEDLARAVLVLENGSLRRGVARGLDVFKRAPFQLGAQWFVRSAAAFGAVPLAAFAVAAVDVSRPGAWRWLVAAAIHQAVLLLCTALRASWLARALAAVASYERDPPASR